MPHTIMSDDFRTELLIWILIDAFRPRGYTDPDALHRTTLRYRRELGKRGIELVIYPDIVTRRTRNVDDAAIRAMEYGILGMQRPGNDRAPIEGSVDPFLHKTDLIT